MLRPAERNDFIAIAEGLSEPRRRALMALSHAPTPLGPLMRIADSSPMAAAFVHDGEVVAVAGAVIAQPGIASIFLYGTHRTPDVATWAVPFFKLGLFPALAEAGVREAYWLLPADDIANASAIESASVEGHKMVCDKLGRNGEDFVLYRVPLTAYVGSVN